MLGHVEDMEFPTAGAEQFDGARDTQESIEDAAEVIDVNVEADDDALDVPCRNVRGRQDGHSDIDDAVLGAALRATQSCSDSSPEYVASDEETTALDTIVVPFLPQSEAQVHAQAQTRSSQPQGPPHGEPQLPHLQSQPQLQPQLLPHQRLLTSTSPSPSRTRSSSEDSFAGTSVPSEVSDYQHDVCEEVCEASLCPRVVAHSDDEADLGWVPSPGALEPADPPEDDLVRRIAEASSQAERLARQRMEEARRNAEEAQRRAAEAAKARAPENVPFPPLPPDHYGPDDAGSLSKRLPLPPLFELVPSAPLAGSVCVTLGAKRRRLTLDASTTLAELLKLHDDAMLSCVSEETALLNERFDQHSLDRPVLRLRPGPL
uniref:Uncharacterized protein n=1 Tax=Noctiluca scintillans TaxID=2966 RepID=A0A7S1AAI7_NOCSC|mmetsp:Transcript_38523/g.102475  ORF Transcript_38523/g.102475 Transcript_38523/m.102475 type:complete len:375 (+) Transcript_38523:99-1223(+)